METKLTREFVATIVRHGRPMAVRFGAMSGQDAARRLGGVTVIALEEVPQRTYTFGVGTFAKTGWAR